jgi:hypothetical protein
MKSPTKGKAAPVMRGTPRKRHLSSTDAELNSPKKCPASPGPSRTGLRSATPKKMYPEGDEKCALPLKSPVKNDKLCNTRLLASSSSEAASEKLALLQESERNRPPIVIIFEDFESFSNNVLQDFITICGLVNHRCLC